MNLEELNKMPLGKMIALDENEGIQGYFGGIVKDNQPDANKEQILLITSFITHKAGEDTCFGVSQVENYKLVGSTYSLNNFLQHKKIVESDMIVSEGWCDLKKGFSNLLMEKINETRKDYLEVSK